MVNPVFYSNIDKKNENKRERRQNKKDMLKKFEKKKGNRKLTKSERYICPSALCDRDRKGKKVIFRLAEPSLRNDLRKQKKHH
jgi:hypothetical protein